MQSVLLDNETDKLTNNRKTGDRYISRHIIARQGGLANLQLEARQKTDMKLETDI
jgi:hypothetical protein